MEIFIANIPFASVEDDIQKLFEVYGAVERVSIIRDRETGDSRGYGFVEIPDEDEARAAIEALDGVGLQGRSLYISKARPSNARPGRRG